MSRRGECNREKERFWRSMLRQWRRSGLSIRDFCADHHLAQPTFYAWRRTIAQFDEQARRPRHTDHGQPDFVPLRLADANTLDTLAPTTPLEVLVAGQRVVRVPVGFDAVTLRQLLAVLEETPPC
jgi:hypothetical protein